MVWHEKRGYSPDEIVDMFPGITLADVYAALTYYFDNRQEIEDEFRKSDEWADWAKANIPSKIPADPPGEARSGVLDREAMRNHVEYL